MAKTTISIEFDLHALENYSDEFLQQLWHVAQAQQVPITNVSAGRTAEQIGREIIRRWLSNQQPALWSHQGAHEAYALRESLRAGSTA